MPNLPGHGHSLKRMRDRERLPELRSADAARSLLAGKSVGVEVEAVNVSADQQSEILQNRADVNVRRCALINPPKIAHSHRGARANAGQQDCLCSGEDVTCIVLDETAGIAVRERLREDYELKPGRHS